MILEVAHVDIIAGHQREFEAALREASGTVLPQARGFIDFTAHGWGVERPSTYLFTIAWKSLDDHLVGFRDSELFTQWRDLIGPHFASPPVVEHYQL